MTERKNHTPIRRENGSFAAMQGYGEMLGGGLDSNYRQSTETFYCVHLTEGSSFTIKSLPSKRQLSIRKRLVRYGHYDKLQG